jgi:hypothetical protein
MRTRVHEYTSTRVHECLRDIVACRLTWTSLSMVCKLLEASSGTTKTGVSTGILPMMRRAPFLGTRALAAPSAPPSGFRSTPSRWLVGPAGAESFCDAPDTNHTHSPPYTTGLLASHLVQVHRSARGRGGHGREEVADCCGEERAYQLLHDNHTHRYDSDGPGGAYRLGPDHRKSTISGITA